MRFRIGSTPIAVLGHRRSAVVHFSKSDWEPVAVQAGPYLTIGQGIITHNHSQGLKTETSEVPPTGFRYPVIRTMLLCRALCFSLKSPGILFFLLVLTHVLALDALTFCSRNSFGIPRYRDCASALSAVPKDSSTRYFVEQQLRTRFPGENWVPFVDPRPPGLQKNVVQLPKWWSYGKPD